jgi:hypothetical protein
LAYPGSDCSAGGGPSSYDAVFCGSVALYNLKDESKLDREIL